MGSTAKHEENRHSRLNSNYLRSEFHCKTRVRTLRGISRTLKPGRLQKTSWSWNPQKLTQIVPKRYACGHSGDVQKFTIFRTRRPHGSGIAEPLGRLAEPLSQGSPKKQVVAEIHRN